MTRSHKDKNPMKIRNLIIKDLYRQGVPMTFIAKVFNLTGARVCQILGGC